MAKRLRPSGHTGRSTRSLTSTALRSPGRSAETEARAGAAAGAAPGSGPPEAGSQASTAIAVTTARISGLRISGLAKGRRAQRQALGDAGQLATRGDALGAEALRQAPAHRRDERRAAGEEDAV